MAWQNTRMVSSVDPVVITRALVEQLTIEAMVLADEAESYFSGEEEPARAELAPELQVAFACEAFRTAARLKQLVDWLARHDPRGLAVEPWPHEPAERLPEHERLPPRARAIVAATHELCERVAALRPRRATQPVVSPARMLQAQLEAQLAQ